MPSRETKSMDQYREDYYKYINKVNSGMCNISVKPSQIQVNICKYVNEYIINTSNKKYKKWEDCYRKFKMACEVGIDKEGLSNALADYLLCFGMGRNGKKTFLEDRVMLYPVVEFLFSDENKFLFALTPREILEDCEVVLRICETSRCIRKLLKAEVDYEVTNTMVTKMLMGVYGTIPAFDRFLCASANCTQVAADRNFPVKHILRLAKFYLDNERDYFKVAIRNLGFSATLKDYPEMRLVDIVMWQEGALLN